MDAKTAANYMVYIMADAFDDLTNMKINKLLYYSQGYYLKRYKRPMYDDEIEAWDHGPVIPEVYSTYKKYDNKPIKSYDVDMVAEVAPEVKDIIFGVARKYGGYNASALRNMTHVIGSPWDQVYQKGDAHIKIPLPIMQDYFANLDDLTPATRQFKESDFIGYRDKDGILVLPKDWDDGEV